MKGAGMKFFLSGFLFFFIFNANAESQIDVLNKRIEALERNQEDLLMQSSEEGTKVNTFLKSHFTLGGFFEPSYTLFQGKDTSFKAASASNLLGLNISAEYSTKLKFVSQILTGLTFPMQNIHNDPRDPVHPERSFGAPFFGALLTQGYLEYDFGNGSYIQGGQGYAPFGYAAQQRELVLFIRRGGPQILRTTELFNQIWSGFHFHHMMDQGSFRTGYNVYSFSRLENAETPGLGARVWIENTNGKLGTGLSVQSAKYNGHIEEIYGYDIKVQTKDFLVTSEYAIHLRTDSDNTWSAYVEPSVFLYKEEVLLYTFLDFAQSSANKTGGTISDPFQKYEYGTGVNWLPTSYTRLRAGLTIHDYVDANAVILGKNRDYVSLDISAGVAF
jgi:hypothetical protein